MKFAYSILFCLSSFLLYGFDSSTEPTELEKVYINCQSDSCILRSVWDLASALPRGEVHNSLRYASILSNIGKKNQDTISIVRSHIIHGNVNLVTFSRYDSVKIYAQKGLSQIDNKLYSNELARLNNLYGIGILYEGREVESLEYFQKAQLIYRKLKDYCQMATMTHNIAKLYKMFGNEVETATLIQEAIVLKNQHNCGDNISYMYLNLSAFFEKEKQIDSTLKYARLTVLEDISNHSDSEIGPAYMLMAKAFNQYNLIDSAIFYIDKSIVIAEKHNNIKLKSFAYLTKSEITTNLTIDTSLIYIEKAMKYVRPNSTLHVDILKQKSLLIKKLGNYKESLELIEKANIIRDSLTGIVEYGEIKSKEAKESEKLINTLELESQKLTSKSNRSRFILFTVLFLSSLLSLFFFWKFKRWKKTQEKHLAYLERTKELALSKSQMNLLRSQMNPHFIFNSLNSIKSFFIRNDQNASIAYLSEFSTLIRGVLENSAKDMIPLSENIQWIKNYCALENKRLNNSINYKIIYDKHADLSNIMIPPMLIQPFVENAIWHGLSPKINGERQLRISYIINDSSHIICEIDDNGLGFPLGNVSNRSGHISLGTRITEERLKAIEKFYNGVFSFEVTHKKELGDEGTKVVLKLPVVRK